MVIVVNAISAKDVERLQNSMKYYRSKALYYELQEEYDLIVLYNDLALMIDNKLKSLGINAG